MSRRCGAGRLSLLAVALFVGVLVSHSSIQRYQQEQKYQRLQGYRSELSHLSHSMQALAENSALLEERVAKLKNLMDTALRHLNATRPSIPSLSMNI